MVEKVEVFWHVTLFSDSHCFEGIIIIQNVGGVTNRMGQH
jgi:hypothetical protein